MIMFGKAGKETAHHNDMHYQKATLCYDANKDMYILPGSGRIKGEKRSQSGKLEGYTQHASLYASKQEAKDYIIRLNALM